MLRAVASATIPGLHRLEPIEEQESRSPRPQANAIRAMTAMTASDLKMIRHMKKGYHIDTEIGSAIS
jgi:hypothetical protein